MVSAPQHVSRRLSYKPSIFLALLYVIGTACSTTAPTGKILFEDPRGTVSHQTMADQSIQATQPITLEPTLIAQVLKGMAVQDQERGIQRLLAGRSSPVPVFSDDQIQFLAPLLAEGLRTAAPTEGVAYRVQTTREGSILESSITETTAGSLYAYGRQLHVTLSQDRYAPTRANLNVNDTAYRMSRPDSSGLRDRILLFTSSCSTFQCLRSAHRKGIDRSLPRHRLPTPATGADSSNRRADCASDGNLTDARIFSRSRRIRIPSAFYRSPVSGGGSSQEGTAIRSTTTRQPTRQARQPKTENRTAEKMKAGVRG